MDIDGALEAECDAAHPQTPPVLPLPTHKASAAREGMFGRRGNGDRRAGTTAGNGARSYTHHTPHYKAPKPPKQQNAQKKAAAARRKADAARTQAHLHKLTVKAKRRFARNTGPNKPGPALPGPHGAKATPQAHGNLPRDMTNRNKRSKSNKCYRNALLQALLSVASIRRALELAKGQTAMALRQIANNLSATTNSSMPVPERLLADLTAAAGNPCRFSGNKQQDPNEYLDHILNGRRRDTRQQQGRSKDEGAAGSTLFHRHTPTTLTQCPDCGQTPTCDATDLQEQATHSVMLLSALKPSDQPTQLTELIRLAMKEPADDDRSCPLCGKNRIRAAPSKFATSPLVLIAVIGRAASDYKQQTTAKIHTPVVIQEQLDLRTHAAGDNTSPAQYTLRAVIHHKGRHLHAGHYTTHFREES